MSSFNPIERAIASILSRAPFIKKVAKYLYSRLVFIINRGADKKICDIDVSLFSDEVKETFFGYYDKSPSNSAGLVLYNSTENDTATLPTIKPIAIKVYSKKERKVLFEVTTSAYNWQQGARAHWLSNDEFIFNDFDKNKQSYCARVFSVSGKSEVATYTLPVQESFQKDYFLSINYERLMALRPDYGYRNKVLLTKEELDDINGDGIWKVDFSTGMQELLISIDDVYKAFPNKEMKQAIHKFNHIMISPDGTKFIFMHRCILNGQRFDRLFVINSDGSNLKLIADNKMVSHCFWRNENTIFGYLRGKDGRNSYWLIDVNSGQFTEFKNELLAVQGDGHPHVYGDYFITDTYPDKARMQKLLLGNFKTGDVKVIGQFFHGFKYSGETRCDLHPRFSSDGKSVFFDSVYSGKRNLCEMDVTL